MLSPLKTICLCNPGTRPLNNAKGPSSAVTLAIVPNNPLYFGSTPGSIFYSCNLTLTESIGIVATSAMQHAVAAIPIFLSMYIVSLSPGLFVDCISFLFSTLNLSFDFLESYLKMIVQNFDLSLIGIMIKFLSQ